MNRRSVFALAVCSLGVGRMGAQAQERAAPKESARAVPKESARSNVRPYFRERTEQWTLRSKLGRTFEISVSLPKLPPPANGYPILYVTDADTQFATLADTIRMNEHLYGAAVVVGVGYPNDADISERGFDLTPSPVSSASTWSPAIRKWSPAGGGADEFFAFIQSELKPQIERSVKIDKSREGLFGHSLGGLFVLHVLCSHPDAFDTYVAGSPSIWWGGRQILKEVPSLIRNMAAVRAHTRLLIAVGGLENDVSPEALRYKANGGAIPDLAEMRELDMVGSAVALAGRLKTLDETKLEVIYQVFPDEAHTSVVPAYLSRGARYAMNGWASRR